jgi:hypothetical protein
MRYLDRRLRIRVRVDNALTVYREEMEKTITIKASNVGGRKTTLSNFKFLLTRGRQFLWMDPRSVTYVQNPHPMPYEFAPGEQDFKIMIRMQSVADALRKNGYSGVAPIKAIFDGLADTQHESEEMCLITRV